MRRFRSAEQPRVRRRAKAAGARERLSALRRPEVIGGALTGLSALAAQSWFKSGTIIATGDNFPVAFFRPSDALQESRWVWGTSITSTGGPDYSAVLQTLPAAFAKGTELLGFGPITAQRLFLTMLFASVAPAMFFLLRTLFPNEGDLPGVFVGAVFYAFNPALFFVIPNTVLLTAWILFPLTIALVIRGVQRGGWRYPLALALASPALAYAFTNPAAFAVVVAATLLTLAVMAALTPWRLVLTFLVRTVPLVSLLNLWWLAAVAIVYLRSGGQPVSEDVNPFNWSWTHHRSSLPNVARLMSSWSWPKPEYFPYAGTFERTGFGLAAYVPVLATAAAVVLARGRRKRLMVLIGTIGVVVLILSKGLHPPVTGLNAALYRHVPGMWILREPGAKLSVALATILAIGLAVLVTLPPTRWHRWVFSGALGTLFMAMSFPLWSGSVIPDDRPLLPSAHVRVPQYWHEMASFVNERPGRTVLLPPNDYYQMPYDWGFYGADLLADELISSTVIKLIDPRGNTYLEPESRVNGVLAALRDAFEHGRIDDAGVLVRRLGIRWVVLRRDIRPRFPGRKIVDPSVLERMIRGSEVFRHARSFGKLDLFELADGKQSTRVVAGHGIFVRRDTPRAALTLPLPDAPPLLTQDPGMGVNLTEARIVSAEEWQEEANGLVAEAGRVERAAAFIRWPQGVPASVELRPASLGYELEIRGKRFALGASTVRAPFDPQVFRVDGTPDSKIIGIDGGLVGIHGSQGEVDERTLRPGAHQATLHDRARFLIPNASFEADGWGEVGDCYASDSGSPQEAGLRAERIAGGTEGSFALALSARAHSACVQQDVRISSRESVLRLSLDHSRLGGAQPRVCVWEYGPNRCLALPKLDPRRGWRRYEQIIRPDPGVRRLSVFLYADGHPSGTTILYDRVQLESFVLSRTVGFSVEDRWSSLGLVSADQVALTGERFPTTRQASILGGSFEQAGWGRVRDCVASDSRTSSEAGLAAERVVGGTGGESALALSADAHSACVSRRVRGFSPGQTYRLSLDHLRLKGAAPRICVWQHGPDRCVEFSPLDGRQDWRHFEEVFQPDPATQALSVFLYADGQPGGTTILFDRVRIKTIAPFPEVALVGSARPSSTWRRVAATKVNPTAYEIDGGEAGPRQLLVLPETFDPGWKVVNHPAKHLRVDGYANGWVLADRSSPITVRYQPQRWVDLARTISASGAIVLFVIFVFIGVGSLVARRALPSLRWRRSIPSAGEERLRESNATGRAHELVESPDSTQ